jgi:hypothetical protein
LLPTVAPGQNPGALRFVSLALHILPQWAEGTAGTFQRGKFPEAALHLTSSENVFLNSSTASPLHVPAQKNSQHTASLDVLAEPNHYSKPMQTSSTRVFASH